MLRWLSEFIKQSKISFCLGNYGAKGMKAFLKLSEDAGICTAAELQVPQYADTRYI